MSLLKLPLAGSPEEFETEINNVTYHLRFTWNAESSRWALDLSLPDGTALIRNLALVTGENLLAQYAHLGLGFALYLDVDGSFEAEAGFGDLGTQAQIYIEVTA